MFALTTIQSLQKPSIGKSAHRWLLESALTHLIFQPASPVFVGLLVRETAIRIRRNCYCRSQPPR